MRAPEACNGHPARARACSRFTSCGDSASSSARRTSAPSRTPAAVSASLHVSFGASSDSASAGAYCLRCERAGCHQARATWVTNGAAQRSEPPRAPGRQRSA